jgi:hypothetical protein
MRNLWVRALDGYVWGLGLFLVVAYSFRYGLDALGNHSAVVSQIAMKGTLVLIALAAWKLMGRPFSQMGWRGAPWRNRSYVVWFVLAAIAMMAASVTMIFLEVKHPIASQMNFLQIVVVIWLGSSFSEEVYVRGLVQSWVANGEDAATPSVFAPSIVVVGPVVRLDARAVDVEFGRRRRGTDARSGDPLRGLGLRGLAGPNQEPLAGNRLPRFRQPRGPSRRNSRDDSLPPRVWSVSRVPDSALGANSGDCRRPISSGRRRLRLPATPLGPGAFPPIEGAGCISPSARNGRPTRF